MRSILPDERTTLTKLDTMGNCCGLTWVVTFLALVLVSLVVSFAPPSTSHQKFTSTNPLSTCLSSVTHHAVSSGWSALSSFVVVQVEPVLADSGIDGEASFTVSGSVVTSDESGAVIETKEIAQTYQTECHRGRCRAFEIYSDNRVLFYSISLSATVESELPILKQFSFDVVCHSSVIAVTSFVVISIVTVVVSLFLLIVVPRRLRPSTKDQWATLVLGLFLFFVDGPWLILKYYTPSVASQLFDLAPEVFHVAFMGVVSFFMASRTLGLANRIFSSWVVRGTIAVASFVLVVLEFCVTKLMPLCTMSLYLQNSLLKYPIYVISALIHVGIVGFLIFGVLSLQIQKVFVLVICSLVFFILEAIYIMRMYIRFFIPIHSIGVSFAADVFYVIIANIVAIFMLITNLPVSSGLAEDQVESNELAEPVSETTPN